MNATFDVVACGGRDVERKIWQEEIVERRGNVGVENRDNKERKEIELCTGTDGATVRKAERTEIQRWDVGKRLELGRRKEWKAKMKTGKDKMKNKFKYGDGRCWTGKTIKM